MSWLTEVVRAVVRPAAIGALGAVCAVVAVPAVRDGCPAPVPVPAVEAKR